MGDLQKYVIQKYESLIKTDEEGKKYILEADIDMIDANSQEKAFIVQCFKMNGIEILPEKITKEKRSPLVRDFNYAEIKGNGLEELDEPVKADLEYRNGELVFSDYDQLDEYIMNVFVPANVRMKVNNGPIVDGEKVKNYPSIQLKDITKLKLSADEVKHVIELLENEGIRVGGTDQDLDGEFENYDYARTYATRNDPKPLSQEEEKQKFLEYYETKDPVLLEELVNRNLRLIDFVAWKLALRHKMDENSLISYGYEGLLHAIKNYNPYLGYSFSTYASLCIGGHIKRGIADEKGYTDGERNHYYGFEAAKYIVEKEWGQKFDNSDEMLADILELMAEANNLSADVISWIRRKYKMKNSVDTKADVASNVRVESDVMGEALKDELFNALSTLTEREQKILALRFGLVDGRSRNLDEVGKIFGFRPERVRQIEAKALRKLRHPSRSRKLIDFMDGLDSGDVELAYDDSVYGGSRK